MKFWASDEAINGQIKAKVKAKVQILDSSLSFSLFLFDFLIWIVLCRSKKCILHFSDKLFSGKQISCKYKSKFVFYKYVNHRTWLTHNTAKNTIISPNFLVWKFCGKAQFPYNFGWIARSYTETVPFHKISTPGH